MLCGESLMCCHLLSLSFSVSFVIVPWSEFKSEPSGKNWAK